MGELSYQGHRVGFGEYGEGERPIVLVHGLLMNRRMFDRLGPALALAELAQFLDEVWAPPPSSAPETDGNGRNTAPVAG